MTAKARTGFRTNSESTLPSDLRTNAIKYDKATTSGGYYRKQERITVVPGSGASPLNQQSPTPGSEELLYLVEKAAEDFHAELPYIKSLRGSDKSDHLAGWREHLAETARRAAELIGALEKELAKFS